MPGAKRRSITGASYKQSMLLQCHARRRPYAVFTQSRSKTVETMASNGRRTKSNFGLPRSLRCSQCVHEKKIVAVFNNDEVLFSTTMFRSSHIVQAGGTLLYKHAVKMYCLLPFCSLTQYDIADSVSLKYLRSPVGVIYCSTTRHLHYQLESI